MPRGGPRPGAGRPRKGAAPKAKTEAPADEAFTPAMPPLVSPLDYMLAVMRAPEVDATRRDRMAQAAAPFVHKKMGEAKTPDKPEVPGADAWGSLIGGEPARPN